MPNWIDLDGLANLRDLGGIPTTDGIGIRPGRLLRSDNLQTLTTGDIATLQAHGLTDVIDLRSRYERRAEGPGPLQTVSGVRMHAFSLIPEPGDTDVDDDAAEEIIDEALPWIGLTPSVRMSNEFASIYLSYLVDRPESVLAALRTVAAAEGAALVHCAAGKDRTGTVVALALRLAGVGAEDVIADYAATTDRIEAVVARLMASSTYRDNLAGRPLSAHVSRPETMAAFLDHLDQEYGGVEAMLSRIGWTPADTAALRRKLRDGAGSRRSE